MIIFNYLFVLLYPVKICFNALKINCLILSVSMTYKFTKNLNHVPYTEIVLKYFKINNAVMHYSEKSF